ncbi:MAG: UbiD family decarboxylase [Crenarchaeota archaeon]|nr:UbiD family decarboxylase [Thermoproteota archaeon]
MHAIAGSVSEALDTLAGAGVKPVRLTLDGEPIAPRLWGSLGSGRPVIYGIKGVDRPRLYVSGLGHRDTIRHLLGVGSVAEAYTRLLEAAERRDGRLIEDEFNKYFEKIGSDFNSIHVPVIYEEDGGPYVTAGVFIACIEDEGVCNASIHRIHVKPEGHGAVRVVPRHLYTMLEKRGRLPVAVAVGVHPLVLLAAATSPPYGVFELELAATLTGGLRVCRTPLHGLPVPCGASYVVEGVLGGEREEEGPFVDILGNLDRVRMEPVLRPEAVYENRVYEPYMHVIVQASPEHLFFMGFPREAMIYGYASRIAPGRVRAVRLTPGSGGWLHAVVAVHGVSRQEARNLVFAAWAAHPSLKSVIIVDDDIDVDNPYAVEWALATRFQAGRDLVVVCGARGSSLDPSSGPEGTCKTGFIALRGEGPEYRRVAPWPRSC